MDNTPPNLWLVRIHQQKLTLSDNHKMRHWPTHRQWRWIHLQCAFQIVPLPSCDRARHKITVICRCWQSHSGFIEEQFNSLRSTISSLVAEFLGLVSGSSFSPCPRNLWHSLRVAKNTRMAYTVLVPQDKMTSLCIPSLLSQSPHREVVEWTQCLWEVCLLEARAWSPLAASTAHVPPLPAHTHKNTVSVSYLTVKTHLFIAILIFKHVQKYFISRSLVEEP